MDRGRVDKLLVIKRDEEDRIIITERIAHYIYINLKHLTMKKVIMLAAVVAALASCQSKGTEQRRRRHGHSVMAVPAITRVPKPYMKEPFLQPTVRVSSTY